MSRYLSIDFGSKRTGIAVSDPLGVAIRPLCCLEGLNRDRLLNAIVTLIANEDIGQIVIGLPLTLDGGDSPQTEKTRRFAQRLGTKVDVPIRLFDERYTSSDAEALLESQGFDPISARKKVDGYAAALILRAYFNNKETETP